MNNKTCFKTNVVEMCVSVEMCVCKVSCLTSGRFIMWRTSTLDQLMETRHCDR